MVSSKKSTSWPSVSYIAIFLSLATALFTGIGKYYSDMSEIKKTMYNLAEKYDRMDRNFSQFYSDFIDYELKKVTLEIKTTNPSASDIEREKYITLNVRKRLLERYKRKMENNNGTIFD